MPASQFNAYDGAEAQAAGADQGRPERIVQGRQVAGPRPKYQRSRSVNREEGGWIMATTIAPKQRQRGPKLEPHQVILRPLITEKGTHQSTHEHHNAYSFQVNLWANKDADQGGRPGIVQRPRREGAHADCGSARSGAIASGMGKLSNWKKAIVKLHPEDKIEFF